MGPELDPWPLIRNYPALATLSAEVQQSVVAALPSLVRSVKRNGGRLPIATMKEKLPLVVPEHVSEAREDGALNRDACVWTTFPKQRERLAEEEAKKAAAQQAAAARGGLSVEEKKAQAKDKAAATRLSTKARDKKEALEKELTAARNAACGSSKTVATPAGAGAAVEDALCFACFDSWAGWQVPDKLREQEGSSDDDDDEEQKQEEGRLSDKKLHKFVRKRQWLECGKCTRW